MVFGTGSGSVPEMLRRGRLPLPWVVMQALLFDPSPRRLPLAAAASRLRPLWALRGPAPLSLREVPDPVLPGKDWVRLRVLGCGICGSDLKEALLQASWDNPLSGLVSFPHVPGHEMVAIVDGPAPAGSPQAGQVVAVDPWLGCRARGLERLCPACSSGFPPHCRAAAEGGPWGTGQGMHLGNVRGLPGGFGPLVVAHRSQLHPLPVGLDPSLAVLADPLAVGIHAVEQVEPDPEGPVLVFGAGTIGLCLALAARFRWPAAELLVTAAWEHQRPLVRDLEGEPLPVGGEAVVGAMASRAGGRLVHPWHGGSWSMGGGAAVVLDSVGSPATLELALRSLAPGGQVVTVGVGRPGRAETTLAYHKEARLVGSNGYGTSRRRPDRAHQLDLALELLAERQESVGRWLTHSFPLSRWREAFGTAASPHLSGAIKVTLQPDQAGFQ